MAGTLTWPIDKAFKAMVSQAVANESTVKLVKDQSVYLMAFGKKHAKDNKVIYAQGLDPDKVDFDVWYDKAHRICGGDDFGEDIPTEFLAKIIDHGAKKFVIKLTPPLVEDGGHPVSYVFYITGKRPIDEYRRAYVPVIKDTHSKYARDFLSTFLKGQEYQRQGNTIILANGDRIRCDKFDDLFPLIPNPDPYCIKPEDHQRILSFKYGRWEGATNMVQDAIIMPAVKPKQQAKAQRPDDYVTITELCAASGVLPSDARAILRASGREKPSFGWAFAPDEVREVKKLCGIK